MTQVPRVIQHLKHIMVTINDHHCTIMTINDNTFWKVLLGYRSEYHLSLMKDCDDLAFLLLFLTLSFLLPSIYYWFSHPPGDVLDLLCSSLHTSIIDSTSFCFSFYFPHLLITTTPLFPTSDCFFPEDHLRLYEDYGSEGSSTSICRAKKYLSWVVDHKGYFSTSKTRDTITCKVSSLTIGLFCVLWYYHMQSELIDSRLVLPNADRECKSCRKKIEQDCEGHFGHIVLPTPIYHPNYVPEIVRMLNQICLMCFELR